MDTTDSMQLCACGHQALQHAEGGGECQAAGCACGAMALPEESEPADDAAAVPA
jgi:hypothetical protein